MSWRLLLVNAVGAVALVICSRAPALGASPQKISFSGYQWQVRPAGNGGPGPNLWAPGNVWVDKNGWLHLKISHDGNGWHCAELETTRKLGFGRYQFQVIGRVDQLDPNVVLGLFDYPSPGAGPDGTNEIDIEFAQWGDAKAPHGNYTVYPPKRGPGQASTSFPFALDGDYTTHRFVRGQRQVSFQSLYGHQEGNANEFKSWVFRPRNYQRRVPQKPLPVHLNLWLFQGAAPTDGKEVELTIRSFKFTPMAS